MTTFRAFLKTALAAFCGLALMSLHTAHAFQVSPLSIEMSSQGVGATGRITVRNVWDTDLPIETSVSRVLLKEDGSYSEEPADDVFLVFPPQAVIPGGETRVFQAQWLGELDSDNAERYFIKVRQVPVKLEETTETKVQLQMTYAFNIWAEIVPPGAKSALSVTNVTPLPLTDEGQRAIEVTFRNDGNRFGKVIDHELEFSTQSADGKPNKIFLTGADLSKLAGGRSGLINPQGQGMVKFYLDDRFAEGAPVTVTISR